MSTPAPVRDARATHTAAPLLLPAPAERSRRRLPSTAALLVVFALAAVYHAVQSSLHGSPAIFTDELLHSKLAQSFAAGDWFSIRGEFVFFPAPLPALLQAPAWLIGDMDAAYSVAKLLNALVMSAAVFPAYWLARQLVRPSFALLAAAAAVAAPALLYHSYLLSEALAYPVFLLAVAVLVRALARPSLRWGVAALGVSALAVGTRTQFIAIPIVFGLLLLAQPRQLRRHLVPAAGLVGLAVLAVLGGGAVLGTYNGVLALDLHLGGTARWTLATGALLPFAAGLLFFPGAVLGLGVLAVRPRSAAESAFARLGIGLAAVFLVQAGVIAAGDAERPLERYLIYLTPLLAIAFFAYVEREAPWRRAHTALAFALAAAAWLVPFSSLADHRFSFDSPVLSAYGTLAHWTGHANAATIFGVVALLAGIALASRRLTPAYARALGAVTIALLLATGLAAYSGDHAMTERARVAWAAEPPDWLDELEIGQADYLGLPGSSPHFAWNLEAWNRDFGRPIWLGVRRPPIDPWASSRADVSDEGTLYVDGRPASAGLLVVNDFGTQIDLEGEILARPREGLTLRRIPEGARVRSLARGLYPDGWSNGDLRYEAWPAAGGVYRVEVSLPAGLTARRVALRAGDSLRTILLESGRSAAVELRVGYAAPLYVRSDRVELVDGKSANPRFRSFVVERIAFEPFTLSVRL